MEYSGRVERERKAHNEHDVLANSARLKKRFCHTLTSPTMKRMESTIEAYLNDVSGKRVLDFGCGRGEQSLRLLYRGAKVSGFDISEKYITEVYDSVKKAGYDERNYDFRVMDAHKIDYENEQFDLVFGRGILHHLDLEVSIGEVRRVLKPGGRAIFMEPLAENPLLFLFRLLTPNARTPDERPLTRSDLRKISRDWEVESSYFGLIAAPVAILTSIVLRPYEKNFLLRISDVIERSLNHITFFRPFNQYVLLNLVRK
jgi:SAM-dependent methyltransferase